MPTGNHGRCIIKAFELDRKVIFEFGTALQASDLLSNVGSNSAFPDPRGGVISLKLRRGLDVRSRRLFLAMGKLGNNVETILHATDLQVGPNGLSGDVHVLRSAEDPAVIVHLAPSGVSDDSRVDLVQPALNALWLESHVDYLGVYEDCSRAPF
eukprot:74242-Pyramimonas_sp.AAC.1